jgi:septal ring factor EnvC (AmiA/AmiB activator)
MFLSIDPRKDPITAVSMLTFLVSRDARAVSRFESQQERLTLRSAQLLEERRKLADTRRLIEERQRSIAATVQQKERLLARLKTEESGSEKQIAELEEKANRLERLVEYLSTQQAGRAVPIDVRTFQGALQWPVDGMVVEKFGLQRNAKFSTVTTNNGVRIAAVTGSPVHAVFQGTVLFSQWFKGYGNLIIVDHGSRVFSLYGNVKAASIAVGDHVNAGQTIAGVGESEEGRAGHLYFEIRRDNHPEDPQKWLR